MSALTLLLTAVVLQTSLVGDMWICGETEALTLTLASCPSRGSYSIGGVLQGTRLSPDGPDVYPGDYSKISCSYTPGSHVVVSGCSSVAEDDPFNSDVILVRSDTPAPGDTQAYVIVEDAGIDDILPCRMEKIDLAQINAIWPCRPERPRAPDEDGNGDDAYDDEGEADGRHMLGMP